MNYPVIWAAGDVALAPLAKDLEAYVKAGGTLVVNSEAARKHLPDALLGITLSGTYATFEDWKPADGEVRAATPFRVEKATLAGAEVLAFAGKDTPLVVRNKVGEGAVITVLVPHGLGLDERAHPVLPYVMNGLTAGLLPVQVRTAAGKPLSGEVMYQVNQTKSGHVVMLMNNRGVDKTQHGIARVDRRQAVEVVVRSALPVKAVRELTGPRDLTAPAAKADGGTEVRVTVHPGDVQVIEFVR
jgi:hypothetical protein